PLIACSVTNTCQSWLLRLAIYFPLSKEKRNYSDKHLITVSPGANQREEGLLSPLPRLKTQ
ncbi:MAG: hypothetical protein KZQ60_11405, partial [Candidatus Thiodiazotropha sp. (ex Lucinoma aequizonata)]|nr:hypothetical protein [Candidatus Thiodiazotropha sp. (ex Lucinoma aequizonata)]